MKIVTVGGTVHRADIGQENQRTRVGGKGKKQEYNPINGKPFCGTESKKRMGEYTSCGSTADVPREDGARHGTSVRSGTLDLAADTRGHEQGDMNTNTREPECTTKTWGRKRNTGLTASALRVEAERRHRD